VGSVINNDDTTDEGIFDSIGILFTVVVGRAIGHARRVEYDHICPVASLKRPRSRSPITWAGRGSHPSHGVITADLGDLSVGTEPLTR
jgi:hypothetical protein